MKPAPKVATGPDAPPKSLNDKASEASEPREETPASREDRELVKRAQAGDLVAFRALYDRYNRRAFAVAMGVVRNQADALDVVQEAFIKVHKHLVGFQGTSSFYTWLYRIVMNVSIDHIRRNRKVTEFDETVRHHTVDEGAEIVPRHRTQNASKEVSRDELTTYIQAALDTLPEYHRAVILLREVEGMTYEEMATILNVPKGTIMSRLFHARRKMTEQLEPYLTGELKILE
jgi:RNA polymerase sigma-70 factor (ECF subfamily)